MIEAVKTFLLALQAHLCETLEALDGQARFQEDHWQRQQGGGGRTRVIADGNIFEKGGVNFSHVYGKQLPPSATAARPALTGRAFEALGLSLVLHPDNPYIPTTHANFRFFMAEKLNEPTLWWFGGGYDLTPYYGIEADCQHWHRTAKAACMPYGKDLYPRFKQWCDDYFYLPHRQEPRGIGGLFFDDFNELGFKRSFDFVKSVANSFLPAYSPIVEQRRHTPFGEREKNFQKYRRGRYVEFNLLHDRGTLFGIQSGGRTESILMSLPPEVIWQYHHAPTPGSPEEALLNVFLTAREWT